MILPRFRAALGRRPGWPSPKSNSVRRRWLLSGGVSIFFWRPCRRRSLDQIMDAVENYPFGTLKARLVEPHTLSDLEKMDVLFKSKSLNGRKPFQMLANMLAYCCPSGMEQSVMFQYMSSCDCRSPCGHCWENRSLVTSTAWPLGHLWPIWQWPRSSLQLRLQPSRGRSLNVRRSFPGRSLEANRRPLAASRRHLVLILVALLILSRLGLGSGLCYVHWNHGSSRAIKCESPCSWSGNWWPCGG